jgi:hypothetical protein
MRIETEITESGSDNSTTTEYIRRYNQSKESEKEIKHKGAPLMSQIPKHKSEKTTESRKEPK